MKSPKKPSKEPSLPTQDETRRANVLREEMLSQFRTLGEAFSLLRDDVQSMKPQIAKIDKIDADVEILKSAVRSNGQDIRAMKETISGHTETLRGHTDAINANTEAIHAMQADLKNINGRLEVVEAKVSS